VSINRIKTLPIKLDFESNLGVKEAREYNKLTVFDIRCVTYFVTSQVTVTEVTIGLYVK